MLHFPPPFGGRRESFPLQCTPMPDTGWPKMRLQFRARPLKPPCTSNVVGAATHQIPARSPILSPAAKPSGSHMVNNQNHVQETRAMSSMNWAAIDWVSLIALTLLVLIAVRIGERLSFGSRAAHAVLTAVLFALGFAVWSYGLDDTVNNAVAALTTPSSG
jgi:hypothetical protein